MENRPNLMQVEIWSDVMCPFCYIGKRKFENALMDFKHKEAIQITWKSFQLAPGLKTNPEVNINQFLATHKGLSIQQAKAMNDNVTETAYQVGLTYNFDKAVVANSFNAHRFLHLAKQKMVQQEAEEKIFSAYFTEGKNIDNIPTLTAIGKELGLDPTLVQAALESDAFAAEVKLDIQEAKQLGISGVPFFVFDRNYAVSGAQESSVFLETLDKAYEEWVKEIEKPMSSMEGPACQTDGNCD